MDNEVNVDELTMMNWVYGWLCDFYLLDVHFENIPVDFFKENNQGIMFKSPKEVKEILVEKQELRRNNFRDMVLECFDKGESRRVLPLKTKDSNFIFELNLIKSDDVEEHYRKKMKRDYTSQNLYND